MKLRRIPQNGCNEQRPFVLHSVNTRNPEREHLGQPQPAEQADEGLQGEHEQPEEHDDQVGPAAELIRNELGIRTQP